jgi:hypothetical protein
MGTKFTKPADKVHQETLQSAIIYAVWASRYGPAGGKAKFEVRTSLVGEGAPIEVTGTSVKGKKLGKIKDVIYCNRYGGTLDVPQKIDWDDQISFEVQLPKHGLKEQSNKIPVVPEITVKKMVWDRKEAQRGDVVTMTVDFQDVPEGIEAILTIYEYDSDGNHDKIVSLPVIVKNKKIELSWEYEYHEDTDEIATDAEMKKYGNKYNPPEYFFVVAFDEQKFGEKQESGLLLFKDWIEIGLKDAFGAPVANADYVVRLADGSELKGKLDAEGRARLDNVAAGAYYVHFPGHEDGV